MRRRPRNLLFPLLTVSVLVCLLVFAFIALRSITSPVTGENASSSEFVVAKGDSAKAIANKLYQAGLIRSPLGFRYVVKKEGLDSRLQAGTYRLSPQMTAEEVARALTRGIADLSVTIPEGYRLEEISAVLETKLNIPRAEFLTAAQGLEGRLFPDTYFFAPNTSIGSVIETMQDNFTSKVGTVDDSTLILASLVERETKADAEKPIVAGILTKRLASGWPLELDATVQYVLGTTDGWWPVTTLADRKVISPHNTYLHQGLPPGPICNPGLASIEAARNPQASDYWFYLHGRDGVIRYAATLEGHNENIEKYLR